MAAATAGVTGGAAPVGGASGAAAGMQPAAAGAGTGGGGGAAGTAGSGGISAPADAGAPPMGGAGGVAPDAGGSDAPPPDAGPDGAVVDPAEFAAGLHELFMHDACTGEYPPQPDTCLHEQRVEHEVEFGGEAGVVYDLTLRVRGLFEPTTISGAQTPLPQHPYFKVGGSVSARDWSHWHIEVSDPPQTYWLNHYPSTAHVIYKEDFEATIPIAAGAQVVVRVIDGNDRQMDNAQEGLADRRQLIEGVTDDVLDGQMLRLDVISVQAR